MAMVTQSESGKKLTHTVEAAGAVQIRATADAFAWLSTTHAPAIELTVAADAREFAALQRIGDDKIVSDRKALRTDVDEAEREPLGLVFVASASMAPRTIDPFAPTFGSALDKRIAASVKASGPLVTLSPEHAPWLDRTDGSVERVLLGTAAIERGAAPASVPWSDRNALLALLRTLLTPPQQALLDKLCALGRSVNVRWLRSLLSSEELGHLEALASARLIAIHGERALLLSGLSSSSASATREWLDLLRKNATSAEPADHWTWVELHRLLASSDRLEDQRESAKWAKFGAAVLFERATEHSRQERHEVAADLLASVVAIARDGGPVDDRSLAYAVHYEAYNLSLAAKLEPRALCARYRRSVALWPKNALFWQRLIVASGGFVAKRPAATGGDAAPSFEALHAALADARRATDDNDDTRTHIVDHVVSALMPFGIHGVMAALPLARADDHDASWWLLRTALGLTRSRWIWAAPSLRAGFNKELDIVTKVDASQRYEIRVESLGVVERDASFDSAWRKAVVATLLSLEVQLIGDGSQRDACIPLDERWMLGGGALSRWVAALSRLRMRDTPSIRRLRRSVRAFDGALERPRIEVDDAGRVELCWLSPDDHEGQLIVEWVADEPARVRWLRAGRREKRPKLGDTIEAVLKAISIDDRDPPADEAPRALAQQLGMLLKEGAALYRAPTAGGFTDLMGQTVEIPEHASAFFVDLMPDVRWAHPCVYAWQDGERWQKLEARWPPRSLSDWTVLRTEPQP